MLMAGSSGDELMFRSSTEIHVAYASHCMVITVSWKVDIMLHDSPSSSGSLPGQQS